MNEVGSWEANASKLFFEIANQQALVAIDVFALALARFANREMRQAWRMRILASMHTDRTTPRSIEELKARIEEYRV